MNVATVDSSGTLGAGPALTSLATSASVTALGASVGTLNTSVTALQAASATQAGQITTLQGQTATLFNLANVNTREIQKANEGVAIALAMESPAVPAGSSFALSGGVGYFNNRAGGSLAVSARVGEKATLSAGVGAGFNTGEVGARGGFQIAW